MPIRVASAPLRRGNSSAYARFSMHRLRRETCEHLCSFVVEAQEIQSRLNVGTTIMRRRAGNQATLCPRSCVCLAQYSGAPLR